jgi:DNA-binding transcriptional regulator YiaG
MGRPYGQIGDLPITMVMVIGCGAMACNSSPNSDTAPLLIHEAIRAACAGIDQRDLAKAVGVEQSTISRWIRGVTEPSFEKLMRLEVAAGRPRGFVLRLAGMIDDEAGQR